MKAFREFILPTSILAGTIIGAGIFSLPYVFLHAGTGLSFFFLALFGLIYSIVHLMYADIVIKNGNVHRFAGLAKIYFGYFGYWFSILMTIVEMFFVLAIYLILSSSFVSLIFPVVPVAFQVIIFWWLGSLIIFSGTKKIAVFEYLAVLAIMVAVAVVVWKGFPGFFEKPFIFASDSWASWLLPFGALLFSLSGRPSIPTVTHYCEKNGLSAGYSKRAIIWGTIVPILVYGLFVIGASGISKVITSDSITGIVSSLSSVSLVVSLAVLGSVSLISSYFAVGLDVVNSLKYDLNFSPKFAAFLVILLPLMIYFSNIGGFIALVEIAGGIFVGLEGIFIVAMWSKMKKGLDEAGIVRKTFIPYLSGFVRFCLYSIFGISIAYVLMTIVFKIGSGT
jgi:amino acid permease